MRFCVITASLLLCVLGGCVFIDSRSWKEIIDQNATVSLSGRFSNLASYRSTGIFPEKNNLAELLGLPDRTSKLVDASFSKDTGLTLSFSNFTKIYGFAEGLTITNEGRIQLPASSGCEGDNYSIGCHRKNVIIFVNTQGDLVTIQSGIGGGFAIILIPIPIPIGFYFKNIAIFPRLNP